MKTPNTYVIAFCGPDGTGKSTIANLLSITLSKNGYLTKHIWIKNVHLISYFIASALEIDDDLLIAGSGSLKLKYPNLSTVIS